MNRITVHLRETIILHSLRESLSPMLCIISSLIALLSPLLVYIGYFTPLSTHIVVSIIVPYQGIVVIIIIIVIIIVILTHKNIVIINYFFLYIYNRIFTFCLRYTRICWTYWFWDWLVIIVAALLWSCVVIYRWLWLIIIIIVLELLYSISHLFQGFLFINSTPHPLKIHQFIDLWSFLGIMVSHSFD